MYSLARTKKDEAFICRIDVSTKYGVFRFPFGRRVYAIIVSHGCAIPCRMILTSERKENENSGARERKGEGKIPKESSEHNQ